MRISATEIAEFKECRRRWDYSSENRQNLEPRKPAVALWLGTGVHHALEQYYGIKADLVTEFVKWSDKSIGEVYDQYAGLDVEVENRLYQARELGVHMLDHYSRWAAENDHFEVIYTELQFEIPIVIPGTDEVLPDAFLVGRVDGVIKDQKGFYWVLEHKTFSGELPVDFLLLDEQTTTYQYAMQRAVWSGVIPKIPVGSVLRGVMYNGLRKKAPRVPTLLQGGGLSRASDIDTTYEVYLDAIKRRNLNPKDYEDLLERLRRKGNTFFHREFIQRGPVEMEKFETRLFNVYREMSRKDLPIYPTPNWDCMWRCDYKEPCIACNVGSDEQFVIEQGYIKRKSRGAVYAGSKEE